MNGSRGRAEELTNMETKGVYVAPIGMVDTQHPCVVLRPTTLRVKELTPFPLRLKPNKGANQSTKNGSVVARISELRFGTLKRFF